MLDRTTVVTEGALFPLYATAIERAGPYEWLGLFAVGFVFGAVTLANHWLIGSLAVVALPFLAAIEMVAIPTSHNLFPFEFAFYAIYAALAAAGAAFGVKLRKSDAAA